MESMDEEENIELDQTTQKEAQPEGQAFDEQEMTHVMPTEGAGEGDVDASSDQKELPETAANEHEQELPVDDDSEEDNEPVNLEYQPEQVEETAGSERQLSRLRNEEDESVEEEYAFKFSPQQERKLSYEEHELPAWDDSEEEEQPVRLEQVGEAEEAGSEGLVCMNRVEEEGKAEEEQIGQSKRGRKLSEEEHQDEAKRPKSPAKKDIEQERQCDHGGDRGEVEEGETEDMEDHDGVVIDMQDSSDEWLPRREVQDATQEDMAQEDTAQEDGAQEDAVQEDADLHQPDDDGQRLIQTLTQIHLQLRANIDKQQRGRHKQLDSALTSIAS